MTSFIAEDGKTRCGWCAGDSQYIEYHDNEWGKPVVGDDAIFERISLEGFQAGLSWLIVLKRREHLRKSFHGFSISQVQKMTKKQVDELMQDPNMIRNRRKIESVINNAKTLSHSSVSISELVWSFKPEQEITDYERTTSPESEKLAKELKKLGLSFVGPTTMYAMMQSIGMVNDHHPECFLK